MNSHVIRSYFTMGDDDPHDPNPLGRDGGNNNNNNNNKHPYFLRAKTARHHPVSSSGEEHQELEKGVKPSKKRACRGSKPDHFEEHSASTEDEDLANCLVMLSSKTYASSSSEYHKEESKGKQQVVVMEKGMFQCKACKKIFNSHQALGGHRASHKKVKGCFAAKLDDEENVGGDVDSVTEENEHTTTTSGSDPTRPASATSARKKTKMHECSVCHRVFSSGQALGGHKRCHWLTASTDNAFIPSFQDFQYDHQSQKLCPKPPVFTIPHHHEKDHHHQQQQQLDLNLNLPPHDNSNSTLEASTRFLLQKQLATSTGNVDSGKKGCEMNKLRKLSDLRDVNCGGSGWLQMGTASTAI